VVAKCLGGSQPRGGLPNTLRPAPEGPDTGLPDHWGLTPSHLLQSYARRRARPPAADRDGTSTWPHQGTAKRHRFGRHASPVTGVGSRANTRLHKRPSMSVVVDLGPGRPANPEAARDGSSGNVPRAVLRRWRIRDRPRQCFGACAGRQLPSNIVTPPRGTVCPSDRLPFDPEFGQPVN
jgi:hypothetical protein